jgi:hypothetical protein
MIIIFPYSNRNILSHPTLLSIIGHVEKDIVLFHYDDPIDKNIELFKGVTSFDYLILKTKSWFKFLSISFFKRQWLFRNIIKSKYIVAIDKKGFESAVYLKNLLPYKKIIYINCEIEDYKWQKKDDQFFEKAHLYRVYKFIIQDKWRLKLYQQGTGALLNHTNVEYLPVAFESSLLKKSIKEITSSEKKIVYSGSLVPGFGIFKFFEEIKTKEEIEISYYYSEGLEDFIEIIKASKLNVRIERKFFDSYIFLLNYLSQFEIALAIYDNNFKDGNHLNNSEIGLSSGKVSAYSLLGIPIVFKGSNCLKYYNSIYGFGEEVEKYENFDSIIKKIKDNRDKYSNGALHFYNEVLKPKQRLKEIFK